MKTMQELLLHKQEQTPVIFRNEITGPISLSDEELFETLLIDSGFKYDEKGIYQEFKSGRMNLTNFSSLQYLFNKLEGNQRVRYLKINDFLLKLRPDHLVNLKEFRKLLLSGNYNLTCSQHQFNKLVSIIIKLDNGRTLTDTSGYGKVASGIYNFGNKILVNGELRNFAPVIWLGNKGYFLQGNDMLKICEKGFKLKEIWDIFFKLYGMQAVLIIGYAVASLYFQEYMEREKYFPLLYIKAGSGRGKNGLAELIENLFGIKHPFASINCAGNSTKIGIESKSILLNNLPLILNELTEKEFQFIKSRFDGQGSVKYSEFKPDNIVERTVHGPTVITTVVEPRDKQIISRCLFINLDNTKLQKEAYDETKKVAHNLSSFAIRILKEISLEDIIKKMDVYKKNLGNGLALPRICDNYSLAAAGFEAFGSLIADSEDLPDDATIKDFIIGEIKQTESYLNPLFYFLRELERLSEYKISRKYITQDDEYVYFNFNGVWSIITQAYKNRYMPFITSSNIKNLLKKSKYIARYGGDFAANENHPRGKAVNSYIKRIKEVPRKCFVLRLDELPGYYR